MYFFYNHSKFTINKKSPPLIRGVGGISLRLKLKKSPPLIRGVGGISLRLKLKKAPLQKGRLGGSGSTDNPVPEYPLTSLHLSCHNRNEQTDLTAFQKSPDLPVNVRGFHHLKDIKVPHVKLELLRM